jgi:hypothetical protein
MEHRRFTRVDFRVEGVLTGPNGTARGEVENLSLAGLLLRTSDVLPEGEIVNVHIALSGTETASIEASGKIARRQNGSLAVELQLSGIDIDSLTHLRSVVAYNLGDDERVVSELLGHLRHTAAK